MAAKQCAVVNCSGGKVKGSVLRPNHPKAKDVYTYMGIPFAEPPLGKLRFMPPKPLKAKWNGILEGTKPGKVPLALEAYEEMLDKSFMVPKVDLVRDEDCLNLNVYTPDNNNKANLPVMVYFYGGGFSMGSNLAYSGEGLTGLNDVVLVIPNYRLQVFGFMSFGPDSCLPGNAGLWDQIMALKWVKKNIRNFGGNPDNVTIFGESAGSMSVATHVISSQSAGLFHKAIYHSGTILAIPPTSKSHRQADVDKVMEKMGITEKDPKKLLNILQKCSAEELNNAYKELAMKQEVTFNPSFDNKIFSSENIEDILKKGKFNKVPQIIGFNSTEGDGIMVIALPNFSTGLKEEELTMFSKQLITICRPKDEFENVLEKAKQFYLKSSKPDDPKRFSKVYSDIVADMLFVYGSIKTANYVSDYVPVFNYFNDFQLRCFHDEKYNGGIALKPDNCRCDHADDIFMSFGMPFLTVKTNHNPAFTEEEKTLSENIMKYLTNFAKTGNPNEGKSVPVQWPKYKTKNPQAISFDVSNIKTFKNERKEAIEFWDKTY